jgi:hypothetical protein
MGNKMPRKPIFSGLIIDENDQPVEMAYVGDEPCYVVNDRGFRRHIPSEQVDRQIFEAMMAQVKGNEDQISEQTAKMLGQDDIFSRAMIATQLKNIDQQFNNLLQTGIPEDGKAYLGMMGFRVVINLHGEVIRVDQPSAPSGEGDE